jgi:hypothetical protein
MESENILLPEFYDYLEVVLYNGPPNTIYGKYYGRVTSGDEYSILTALKECCCTCALFKNIINPSDNVILCYLELWNYMLLKDVKLNENPSKSLIYKSILINALNFKDYKLELDESEIIKLLKQGANIYKYIDDLTLEMSKLVLQNKYTKDLTYFKYWDNELIDMIIDDKYITSDFDIIPDLSLNQIIKAISINPLRLKCFKNITFDLDLYVNSYKQDHNCIEYIPYDFQTDYMHKDVRINHLLCVRFLRDKNQDDFNKLIHSHKLNIRYVPEEFQTLEMCKICVEYDKQSLKYCYFIDNEILTSIFKSECNKNNPRKDRFNFIGHFNEDALIRILKVKIDLLGILSVDKQTDRLVREILQSNGYALQYVINPTKENIDIALLQEPKAIKYVKTL